MLLLLFMAFLPSVRFSELIFVYLAFDAAAAAGMTPGGTSCKHINFAHVCVVLNSCASPA